MMNSKVNYDVLVDGFEAFEALMDMPGCSNDICNASMDQIFDSYDEFRKESEDY